MTAAQRLLWKCLLVCLVGFSVLVGCRMSFIGPTTRGSGRAARAERQKGKPVDALPEGVADRYLYVQASAGGESTASRWVGFYDDGRVVASLGHYGGPHMALNDSVGWGNAPVKGYVYRKGRRMHLLILDARSAEGYYWLGATAQGALLLLTRKDGNGSGTVTDTFRLSARRLTR